MTDKGGPFLDEVRRSIERPRTPVPSPARSSPDAPPVSAEEGPARPVRARSAPKPGPKQPAPDQGQTTRPTGAPTRPTGAPSLPSGVAMDPRIKRRRIDVRRDEGRKRLRILLGCLGVTGAVALAAVLARSPLFDVDYADARGFEHTPRADIVRAAGLDGHPAMLDVDTATVASAVEALPWILEATARREWPGTIRIDVTERTPAAVLPAAAGLWALADHTGRILQIGPDKPAGLPVIGNIPPPVRAGASVPAAATASLEVAAAMPAAVRERVADIATLGTGEVELQLTSPGGVVRLGPPLDLDTKLSVLATVLARADLARVSIIDVRVPRAPALTRR